VGYLHDSVRQNKSNRPLETDDEDYHYDYDDDDHDDDALSYYCRGEI
jgi:hypothetical protein